MGRETEFSRIQYCLQSVHINSMRIDKGRHKQIITGESCALSCTPKKPNEYCIILVFIDFMCGLDRPHRLIIRYLTINFRCSRLVEILNTLLASYSQTDSIRSTGFPEDHHLLTEDRAIRGLLWAEKYYPPSWFTDEMIADEQKPREDAVSILERKCRILWLAFRIADKRLWIYYNEEACRFSLLEVPPLDAGINLPTRLVSL
jgi:hypothetical protein